MCTVLRGSSASQKEEGTSLGCQGNIKMYFLPSPCTIQWTNVGQLYEATTSKVLAKGGFMALLSAVAFGDSDSKLISVQMFLKAKGQVSVSLFYPQGRVGKK